MMLFRISAVWLALFTAAEAGVFDGCAEVDSNGNFVKRLSEKDRICACGASLPNALYQIATFGYEQYGRVSYTATGSSTGQDSAMVHAVDFAGSDSLLKESQYAASPDLMMYPAVAAAVVPVYNIPAIVDAGEVLVLDRSVLPKIFMGDIDQWNDPEIKAIQDGGANGTVAQLLEGLVDKTIKVVVRDDGSGTTEIFTKALSSFSSDFRARVGGSAVLDWCEDGMEDLDCPGDSYTNGVCDSNPAKKNCFGGKGECEGITWELNSGFKSSGTVTCQKAAHGGRSWSYVRGYTTAGVAAAVLALEGSLGYAVLADALSSNLARAAIVNSAGKTVKPDASSISYALMELGGNLNSRGNAELYDATSTFAWPIAGYTYYVLRRGVVDGNSVMDQAAAMFDCQTRKMTMEYLEWFYTSQTAKAMAEQLGFTPLPGFIADNVIAKMLSENYCFDAETGEQRLAKKPAEIVFFRLYGSDLPTYLFKAYTSVYREVDYRVQWTYNLVPEDKNELAFLAEASATGSSPFTESDLISGLGVVAFSQDAEHPKDVLAAPLFIMGVVPQYHINDMGSLSDPLTLTLEQLADIILGNLATWDQADAGLPAEEIKVVMRIDACDSTDIVTKALSAASSSFRSAIGPRRQFRAEDLARLGSRVLEASSEEQIDAAITFHDNSIGFWAKVGKNAGKLASVKVAAGSKALEIGSSTLAACEQGSQYAFTTKQLGKEVKVFDVSKSGSEDCWPFSRAFSLTIKESLVGQSQCNADDSQPGDGESKALAFYRWLFQGESITNSMQALGAAPANSGDRKEVFDTLLTFDCNPVVEDDTIYIVIGVGCGIVVCGFLIGCLVVRHFQKKFRDLEKFAHAKLPDNVQEVLEQTYHDVVDFRDGAVCDYIPALVRVPESIADQFGIVICDLEGKVYKFGETETPFTIQSTSKVLLFMLAMESQGKAPVTKIIGTEPTGKPFNDLSINYSENKVSNPYVNAGGIASASLIPGTAREAYRQFEDRARAMSFDKSRASPLIKLDEECYDTEMATNDTNQYIARELHKAGFISSDSAAKVALDGYTLACSMLTTAQDSALMAATYANGGVNPITKEQVIPEDVNGDAVSIMISCGMYNGAGQWIVDVGVPAKSGVGGGVIGVVPGVCGFATYSPRLDQNGNSVRGVEVAKRMSEALGLHVLKGGGSKSAGGSGSHSKDHAQPAQAAREEKVQESFTEAV